MTSTTPSTSTEIWITTHFIGFHCWSQAPDEVAFLRNNHRHVFHVKVAKRVKHDNRDIEFITFKKEVDAYLRGRYVLPGPFSDSCEMIAQNLARYFDADWAEVSEDGENGARVVRTIPSSQKEESLSVAQTVVKPSTSYLNLTPSAPPLGTVDGNLVPVSAQVRTACFVGIEAEGPRRGWSTLFVPGSIDPTELQRAYSQVASKVTQIYYGAGNVRHLRRDTLEALNHNDFYTNVPLAFEIEGLVSSPSLSYLRAEKPNDTLLISLDPRDWNFVDYVKVFHSGCWHWLSSDNSVYTTAATDPLYDQDQTVAL